MTKHYIRKRAYRGPRGERSGNATLTPEKVKLMRESDLPNSYFARLYRVAGETIRRARSGETWSWLEEGLEIEQKGDDNLLTGLVSEVDDEIAVSIERMRARSTCPLCGNLNAVEVCPSCGWKREG